MTQRSFAEATRLLLTRRLALPDGAVVVGEAPIRYPALVRPYVARYQQGPTPPGITMNLQELVEARQNLDAAATVD